MDNIKKVEIFRKGISYEFDLTDDNNYIIENGKLTIYEENEQLNNDFTTEQYENITSKIKEVIQPIL